MTAELGIIIPTFNERDNISPLIQRIEKALGDIRWEIIFVDDGSKDGTLEHLRGLAQKDSRIRCLQRIDRRGLASASIEGMLSSCAPFLAVMDADLQHDEQLLKKMLGLLKTQDYDMVIGSRYMDGSRIKDWSRKRMLMSRLAIFLSRLITRVNLKDPLSGFFMLKREFFENNVRNLTGQGFKILLDLLASSSVNVRVKELPYEFRSRHSGESKLDSLVAWEYILLIIDKLVGRFIPLRFVLFVLSGFVGSVIHLAVLGFCLKQLKMSFVISEVYAIFLAMTMNFFLNNIFTYRDLQLRRWQLLKGLLSFYLICSLGAFVNLKLAVSLYMEGFVWYLAGLFGAVVGSVWNFAVTSAFTWKNSYRKL